MQDKIQKCKTQNSKCKMKKVRLAGDFVSALFILRFAFCIFEFLDRSR